VHTFENFDGREKRFVPVYYTSKIEDTDLLSDDITTTMAMYANMARNYAAMSQINDMMDVARDIVSHRAIQDTRGGRPLIEKINHLGIEFENKILKHDAASLFVAKLDD